MKNTLIAIAATAVLALSSASVWASDGPVGRWKTIDDETGRAKSIVEIYKTDSGTLEAKVLEVLESEQGPNPICKACKGERKNKPIEGMVIAWGLKQKGDAWVGGRIINPANGKEYSARMTPIDGGTRLEVRGFMGFSLLGKTQVWVRE